MTVGYLVARAALVALLLAFGAGESLATKKSKKNCSGSFDCMSDTQKASYRKAAMAACTKKFGSTYKVHIKTNGVIAHPHL
jgi:hypothetical protein